MSEVREIRPWALFLALALPGTAWANVGLPMLMVAWPAYVLGAIPIIVVESFIGTKDLGLSWGDALRVVGVANLWSTLIGIPLAWLAMLVLELIVGLGLSGLGVPSEVQAWFFPFFVAWLPPIGGTWTIYAAFVLLSVPFCIASILVERKIALRKLPNLPPEAVRAWITHANVWSYTLMVVGTIAFPIASASHAT